jgi:transposase-like protein
MVDTFKPGIGSYMRRLPMPWQEVSIMQLRQEFVRLVEQGGAIRPLCRRFGISPTTAYKWLACHRAKVATAAAHACSGAAMMPPVTKWNVVPPCISTGARE